MTSVQETVGEGIPRVEGAGRWLTIGGFSVLDQGLYAGTGFVTSVLIARWVSPSAFGAFAVAFAVLTLLVTLHSASVTEPLGVYGPGKFAGSFRPYVTFIAGAQAVIAVGAAVIVALVGVALEVGGQTEVADAFFGLAVAVPPVLLLWLARRAFYARLTPQWAVVGGAVYAALVLPAIVLLHDSDRLSPATAFLAIGAVSLVVALGLLWRLRAALPPGGERALDRRAILAEHARYARWAVAASLTVWFSAYIQYFVLGPVGFAQVGAMRALDTVLMPYHQFLAAMAAFLLPAFAVRLKNSGSDGRRFVVASGGGLVGLAAAVCLALAFVGESLMSLLYGSTYGAYEYLLPWYALILIPESVVVVMVTVWRARVKTHLVFLFSIVFAAALVAAALIGAHWGVTGVVVARIIVSYVVVLGFLAILIRRRAAA